MAAWAADSDLVEYEIDVASWLPSGQADWSTEIAKAQADVLEKLIF